VSREEKGEPFGRGGHRISDGEELERLGIRNHTSKWEKGIQSLTEAEEKEGDVNKTGRRRGRKKTVYSTEQRIGKTACG